MNNELLELKQAATEHPVLDVIRNRWSARSFTPESLTNEEMKTLIEAAMWAPSAMNEQPWRFMVALRSEEKGFEKLLSFLMPGNAAWAKNAGALVVVIGKKNYAYKDRPNINVAHDCGMATMNLLTQATGMGIFGHVMEGFDKTKVSEVYGLDTTFQPITMVALGRLDETDNLEEPYRSREWAPRHRKSLSEVYLDPFAESFQ